MARKISYVTLTDAQEAAVAMHWLYGGQYEPYPCGPEIDHYHLRSVVKRLAKEQEHQRQQRAAKRKRWRENRRRRERGEG